MENDNNKKVRTILDMSIEEGRKFMQVWFEMQSHYHRTEDVNRV